MLIGASAVVGQAADALEAIRRDQATFVAERVGVEFPQTRTQDLEAFAQAIIGACERIARWRRDRPDVSVADATASLTSLLWSGLAALAQP